MHKIKKLFFALVALLSVALLAGCNGEDPIALIVSNNPTTTSQIVYDFGQADNITVDFSYFRVKESGNLGDTFSDSISTDEYTSETLDNGGVIRTYSYAENSTDALLDPEFKVYVLPETVVASDAIALVVFNFTNADNIIYNIGAEFDPTGIEAYAIQEDGDVIALHETLSAAAFADLFTTEYTPIVDGKYVSQQAFSIDFSYGGYETSFNEFIGTGDKPINADAANWFDYILIIPVAFVMQLFAGIFGNSFAVGILVTTILVRSVAWPIYAKSNDMTMRMSLAQPDIQKLQNKYATRKDPQSQQMMQMEMMQLYKKHKIGVGGCLMPLLQMPIFIAMYQVVRRITIAGGMYVDKVSNFNLLGIDLSLGSQGILSASGILALIVGVTMFLLQHISQKKPSYAKNTGTQVKTGQGANTEQTMKMVSYFMVIMMVTFAYSSNALAFYWVIGNIYSIGQTLINRKINEKKHEQLKQKELLG